MMPVRDRADARSAMPEFADEFGPFLDQAKENPAFRSAFEDAENRARVVDSLVSHRRACGLSQTEVAKRMGVRQPTISQFENEGSDPRLSTLQRYARAIDARLRLLVDVPRPDNWVSPGRCAYGHGKPSISMGSVRVEPEGGLLSVWVGPGDGSGRVRKKSA